MMRAPTSPPPLLCSWRSRWDRPSPFVVCRGSLARYNIGNMTKYIRYQSASGISYGTLDGDTVHQLQGGLFDAHIATGATHQLSGVKLLYPCEPGKILAVGLNYRSHLGTRPQPAHPEMFYKPVSALQNPQDAR